MVILGIFIEDVLIREMSTHTETLINFYEVL